MLCCSEEKRSDNADRRIVADTKKHALGRTTSAPRDARSRNQPAGEDDVGGCKCVIM
jgi:hypothetical protein